MQGSFLQLDKGDILNTESNLGYEQSSKPHDQMSNFIGMI